MVLLRRAGRRILPVAQTPERTPLAGRGTLRGSSTEGGTRFPCGCAAASGEFHPPQKSMPRSIDYEVIIMYICTSLAHSSRGRSVPAATIPSHSPSRCSRPLQIPYGMRCPHGSRPMLADMSHVISRAGESPCAAFSLSAPGRRPGVPSQSCGAVSLLSCPVGCILSVIPENNRAMNQKGTRGNNVPAMTGTMNRKQSPRMAVQECRLPGIGLVKMTVGEKRSNHEKVQYCITAIET